MHGAELVNLLVGAGRLPAELVAGDVQDLQTLAVVIPVQLFNGCVLGREAAACGRVDHQDDPAFVVGQVQLFSPAGGDCIIINHFTAPFLGFFTAFIVTAYRENVQHGVPGGGAPRRPAAQGAHSGPGFGIADGSGIC